MADVRLGATRLLRRARPRAAFVPNPHRYLSLEVSIPSSRSRKKEIECEGEVHRPTSPQPSHHLPIDTFRQRSRCKIAIFCDEVSMEPSPRHPLELSAVLTWVQGRAWVAARSQQRCHSRANRGGERTRKVAHRRPVDADEDPTWCVDRCTFETDEREACERTEERRSEGVWRTRLTKHLCLLRSGSSRANV